MLKIYVDGDACPVKAEILRVAERHRLSVYLVSNRGLRAGEHPLVRRVLVADGPDAADDWIAERIAEGDIVVTSDVRLAARCLAKLANALAPTGKPFTQDSIGMAVAMRDLIADLRDRGEVKSFNASFSKRDRSRFLGALEEVVQAIRRILQMSRPRAATGSAVDE